MPWILDRFVTSGYPVPQRRFPSGSNHRSPVRNHLPPNPKNMNLKHYKQLVLDSIPENSNPQDWRLKNLINNPEIQVRRLLKDMQREGLIDIHYETDRGKVRRILTRKTKTLYDL